MNQTATEATTNVTDVPAPPSPPPSEAIEVRPGYAGQFVVQNSTILIYRSTGRPQLRHLFNKLKKANPNWRGEVINLGPGEGIEVLGPEQCVVLCESLMERIYPELYKVLVQAKKNVAEKIKAQKEAAKVAQEEAVENATD